jgi:hypothetical protein
MMKKFTENQSRIVGNHMNLDWDKYDFKQFHMGMNVELEHGTRYKAHNVTDDDPVMTAKIALAHLEELPDYYTRLEKMETEGEKYWEAKRRK